MENKNKDIKQKNIGQILAAGNNKLAHLQKTANTAIAQGRLKVFWPSIDFGED